MRKPLVLVLAILLLGVVGAGALFTGRSAATPAPILCRAQRGSFRIVLVEDGEFRAAENREIRVDLESRQEDLIIRSVVPEGSLVHKDDLLIEFDSSKLRLEIDQRGNELEIRRKDLVNAEEDLKIARLERTFQLDDAGALIRLAREDLAKYLGIEGPRLRKEAEVKLSRAESELTEKQRVLAEAQRAGKGTLSDFELRRAEREAADAQSDLEIARLALQQFSEYDQPNALRRLKSAVEEKNLLLETRRQSCDAKVTQKEAAILAIRLDLQRKEAELATLVRDLARFQLRAPLEGFVLYGNPNDNPWHNPNDQLVLKEGAKVWPRRTLMTIPDLSVVQVRMQVNERDISKVKIGQAATIDAAALPGTALAGVVERIAPMASPQRQWYPQDNSFEVASSVTPHDPRIKPGMKCKVGILVDEVRDVLFVPLAALRERDGATFCVAAAAPHAERPVRLGRANDEFVEILDGLAAGEELLLSEEKKEE